MVPRQFFSDADGKRVDARVRPFDQAARSMIATENETRPAWGNRMGSDENLQRGASLPSRRKHTPEAGQIAGLCPGGESMVYCTSCRDRTWRLAPAPTAGSRAVLGGFGEWPAPDAAPGTDTCVLDHGETGGAAMTAVFRFLASISGRAVRLVAGVALILVGFLVFEGFLTWVLEMVGLVMVLAGLLDFCIFAPLFGLPFAGPKLREALQEKAE